MERPGGQIERLLEELYPGRAGEVAHALGELLAAHPRRPSGRRVLDQSEAMLITYADQFSQPGEPPLRTLRRFLQTQRGVISAVHLLPFLPYSSDDGFSVVDYLAIHPGWGSWSDVAALARDWTVMFDAVINHISVQHEWFAGFLAGDQRYREHVICVDPGTDLSAVVRPRTSPLLTPFETAEGVRHVWTTFSADQVDLNYANPAVLLAIVEVLLAYVEHGAGYLRLDAVTYLWKEIGTDCVHHRNTHRVLQLIRAVLDEVAPATVVITETNVPHAENVRYFGDGINEAQLVYNFALPPLVLHTFATGDASALAGWAAGLRPPSAGTGFFNFLASHDGIGLRGVEGILSAEQIEALAQRCQDHGGLVGLKTNPDGTASPYELNINYFDALSDPATADDLAVDRFLAAQAIMLMLAGVPGIYVHSLLGSRNDHAGVARTGSPRSINREKFDWPVLQAELADSGSTRSVVLTRFQTLLRARRAEPAFHPQAPQSVVDAGPGVFALERVAADGAVVRCLVNVTAEPRVASGAIGYDLLTRCVSTGAAMRPYEVRWLRPSGPRH